MTREEIVSLLLHLLPPAKNGGSDLRIALTEILRRASVANVLALQFALEGLQKATAARCADCAGPIGQDAGPQDGWQLEDGRTVCQKCCRQDLIRFADLLKAQSESVAALQAALANLQKATQG